jgi:Cu(I)/Ag(I) efflux system membrane protein CusA/SilA
MERVKKRLGIFIPLALLLIFILYHFEFKTVTVTAFIMLAMPFTAIGGILGIKLLGYNMSIAVWAGMIEVVGIGAALCALVMTFLSESYEKWKSEGRIKSFSDIRALSLEGAIRALRPAMMTCSADILGLMPALWATGIGAEFLKRYTAPIIFGLFSALILALVVIPTLFVIWKEASIKKAH